MTELSQQGLETSTRLNAPTYTQNVIDGLNRIHTSKVIDIDRHIVMPIPLSLGVESGSVANDFLKRSGEVNLREESGVAVSIHKGQTYVNKQTGEQDAVLLVEFTYTSKYNAKVVKEILGGN